MVVFVVGEEWTINFIRQQIQVECQHFKKRSDRTKRTKEERNRYGGDKIKPTKDIRYLGIVLDHEGRLHLVVIDLANMIPNVRGPSSKKRRVLTGIIHVTMLHGPGVVQRATKTCLARSYKRIQNGVKTDKNKHKMVARVVLIKLQIKERRK